MRPILILMLLAAITSGCGRNPQEATLEPGTHKGIALEKINTSQYTYMLVNENGAEKWLAFPLADVSIGETYYYSNEMLMSHFVSKELGRTFDEVYFINGIALYPSTPATASAQNTNPRPVQESSPVHMNPVKPAEKTDVKIEAAKGTVSISELFEHKKTFEGKRVTVKGKVTKYSPMIMGKNWIHIQDGSDFKGMFDLTITSPNEVKMGDVVTFEGNVVLDKDFGSGYHYDILIEDAILK